MTTQLGGPLVTAPESWLPRLAAVATLAAAASPATATFSQADSVARVRFLLPDKSLTSSRIRPRRDAGVLALPCVLSLGSVRVPWFPRGATP